MKHKQVNINKQGVFYTKFIVTAHKASIDSSNIGCRVIVKLVILIILVMAGVIPLHLYILDEERVPVFPWHTLVPFLGRPSIAQQLVNHPVPLAPSNGTDLRPNHDNTTFVGANNQPVYHNLEPARPYPQATLSPQYPIASVSHSKPLQQRSHSHNNKMMSSTSNMHSETQSSSSTTLPTTASAPASTIPAMAKLMMGTKSASISAPPGSHI